MKRGAAELVFREREKRTVYGWS